MLSKPLRRLLYGVSALVIVLASVLRWGSRLLIAEDALPAHVDLAVVLQGSMSGEKARLAGAIDLVQRGVADRLIVSLPEEGFWGQEIPPVALNYMKANYGDAIAARVAFCETGPQVDSTEKEADALVKCIRDNGSQKITVVTSAYHTRRAGIIWKRVIQKQEPQLHLWMHAVSDPEFNAGRWWDNRTSAKTWLLETMKLITTVL